MNFLWLVFFLLSVLCTKADDKEKRRETCKRLAIRWCNLTSLEDNLEHKYKEKYNESTVKIWCKVSETSGMCRADDHLLLYCSKAKNLIYKKNILRLDTEVDDDICLVEKFLVNNMPRDKVELLAEVNAAAERDIKRQNETESGDVKDSGNGTKTGDGKDSGNGTKTGDGKDSGNGTKTGDGNDSVNGTKTGDGNDSVNGTKTSDGKENGSGNKSGEGNDSGKKTGGGDDKSGGKMSKLKKIKTFFVDIVHKIRSGFKNT